MERPSLYGGTRMTEPGARILITGVTGLVGSRLAAALVGRAEIVALSRNPGSAQEKVAALSRAWQWSPEGPVPEQAIQGVDAVVHLAGESVSGRWSDARKHAIRSSRVDGTRRLVEAIAAQPEGQRPHVLVSASAIGYYGDTGDRDVFESDPPATDDFLAEVCVAWEREALRAEELGVRVVTPRLGLVMAREGGALEQMLPLFKMGLGGKLGSGKQWWPWIHLDDVVGILQHAIASTDLRGAINATAPTPVRQAEFAQVLASILRRPSFLPAPAFAIKTALGEFGTEVLGSRKVLPERVLASGYEFRFPRLDAALRDLIA